MIETENLTKKFSSITSVKGLTFHVEGGEVFGFLGPNGAGKTTTVRMLSRLISKTSGDSIFHQRSHILQRRGACKVEVRK